MVIRIRKDSGYAEQITRETSFTTLSKKVCGMQGEYPLDMAADA